MCKVLITGVSGFVGKHLIHALKEKYEKVEIYGISRNINESIFNSIEFNFLRVDMLNETDLSKAIKSIIPDYIFHLASESSVSYSWENPSSTFLNNTNIFINLLESVRKNKIQCRILSIGSSEEYGTIQNNANLTEETPLNPKNPYAVARVSQEMLSRVYIDGYNLDIVLTRSFNHIGVGQSDRFVISSFAKQLAQLKLRKNVSKLVTGNLSIVRDFIDVRDVVDAYVRLIEFGIKGEVYNICSGKGYSLKDILGKLIKISEILPEIVIDPNRLRPNEAHIVIGNNLKIRNEINWFPQFVISQSLNDIFNYWLTELK